MQRMEHARSSVFAAVLSLAGVGNGFAALINLVGIGSLPGNASDGLTGLNPRVLEDGTPHDQLGAFGSAIAYTGIGNRYLATTPDRWPADGTRPSCSFEDVNRGGSADLLCHVETSDLALHPGGTEAPLTATTTTGMSVAGTASVVAN